ncbi:MAG: chemotaxis protein CheW [Spirochaetales bacterium]|nr:chemotaxis protein CheW [Spirochaetales bacterium]
MLEVPDITIVHGMPEMIRGVINSRGEVVPVLDLKSKFGNGKNINDLL